jgi:hypothetical protein
VDKNSEQQKEITNMTLALIVLVVFFAVSLSKSAKIKEDKQAYRKRTMTNVSLQDELDAKYFVKIIEDLQALPSAKTLSGDSLIDALEGLYLKYDVPDRRTPEKKLADRAQYLKDIESYRKEGRYPIDDSELALVDRIWHYPFDAPLMDRPDLLVGARNTTIRIGKVEYRYDSRGIPSNLYWTVPAKLVGDLEVLLTTRALNAAGFTYSWDRQESGWQRAEAELKEYRENKKKYPWLYK